MRITTQSKQCRASALPAPPSNTKVPKLKPSNEGAENRRSTHSHSLPPHHHRHTNAITLNHSHSKPQPAPSRPIHHTPIRSDLAPGPHPSAPRRCRPSARPSALVSKGVGKQQHTPRYQNRHYCHKKDPRSGQHRGIPAMDSKQRRQRRRCQLIYFNPIYYEG